MTATLLPNADDARIAEQLALAKALREQGMSGTGGAGYNGGRVYMVGNQGGNLAKMLGGAAMQYFGDKNRSALDATRQQQEADWMAKRPSATTDYAPEGPTETGGNLPVVALPKSAAQRAQETADWAMQGQGIRTPLAQTMAQFGMHHALTAPEKQADRETMIEAQKQSALAKAIEAGEQAAANRQSREDMIRMNIEGRQDLARLAASLRPAPSGSGGGKVDEDAAEFIAQQYLNGDKSVMVGIGRNKELFSAVTSKIAKLAKEGDISAQEAVQRGLEYKGDVASQRTAGTQAANVGMAASEANKMIDISLDLSKKVSRGEFPSINAVGNVMKKQSGDPNIVAFDQSIDSLINGYARAINPRGVATVNDKKNAHERLSTAFSNGQFDATTAVMRKEMEAALAAPKDIRGQLREGRVGAAPSALPGATAAAAPAQSTVVRSQAEWQALPPGTPYTMPDGRKGVR